MGKFLVLGLLAGIFAAPEPQAAPVIDWAAHPENTWVRLSPREGLPVPRFGWEGSGAYDPVHRTWIHQGGHDGIPQGFAQFTFSLDRAAWQQVFPPTSPPGSCCVDGANVFDAANRRFVRFPGAMLGHGWQWSRAEKLKHSAVWLFDPEAGDWTNMRPPPYKEPEKYSKSILGSLNAGATYDPVHEVSLSFGGQTSGGGTNNLFAYDAYANDLVKLEGKNPPEARDGHGIAYDAKGDRLVLFGSQYASDERTWLYSYETKAWEGLALDPHPPGLKGKTYSTIPKMAFDSRNDVVLAITWDEATGNHETWIFDASARRWTAAKPLKEPEPSSSRSRNLAYLPEQNVFLLELVGKDRGPELWTYRLRNAPRPDQAPWTLGLVTEPGKVVLSWPAVPGTREYRVLRALGEKPWEVKYDEIARTTEPGFEDRNPAVGMVAFYRVVAGERRSRSARTQPQVLVRPVVSVLAADKVDVSWNAHPAKDVAGYNVYRGVVSVSAVKKGTPGPWRDNDPEYADAQIVGVKDITNLVKLNGAPLAATSYVDTAIDLGKRGSESGEYRFGVHAYVVRAVNRLGLESGPSPYALTIASEPQSVEVRERKDGAELRWHASREKGIAGYLIYEAVDQKISRITDRLLTETSWTPPSSGGTRRYTVVAVDALGQEGQPSSPAWCHQSYQGFYSGEWHQ